MQIIDYQQLEAMPALCTGQAADLKIDTGNVRVWLSRCSIADGELDPVQVEVLDEENGRWVEVPVDGAILELAKAAGFTEEDV